jgi:hypothetical protein
MHKKKRENINIIPQSFLSTSCMMPFHSVAFHIMDGGARKKLELVVSLSLKLAIECMHEQKKNVASYYEFLFFES